MALAETLASCGYTEEHYREDRMLVDATALVEVPRRSVCRFWLDNDQTEPCILMVFESQEAAIEAHREYAAEPASWVALLWEQYLLVTPTELSPALLGETLNAFLAAVRY